MNFKLFLVAVCGSSVICDPMERSAGPDDEIMEPEVGFQNAPTPAPHAFLENFDEWQTWEATENITKMAPYYKSGYDYDGLPIITVRYGKWNYRELAELKAAELNDFLRYHEQYIRRAQTEGAANNHAGIGLIVDFDGFSLSKFASSHAMKLALENFTSLVRLNDALKYAFAINANFGAETFLNLARPFLGNIMEKFEVYGGQRDKWRPALLRKIPSSQLPPEYGGDVDWKPVSWNK